MLSSKSASKKRRTNIPPAESTIARQLAQDDDKEFSKEQLDLFIRHLYGKMERLNKSQSRTAKNSDESIDCDDDMKPQALENIELMDSSSSDDAGDGDSSFHSVDKGLCIDCKLQMQEK